MKSESVVARESQHTPLPWFVGIMGHDTDMDTQIACLKENEDTQQEWQPIGTNDEDGFCEVLALAAPANAEFIVRACNSHEKLVEALQAAQFFGSLVGGLNSRPRWFTDDAAWRQWVEVSEQAKQALRLAQGEK